MVFDSVTNSSILPVSNAKDFAKKKRGNRSAKLKQSKLDARRQQWLSQVRDKAHKEEANVGGGIHVPPMHAGNERDSVHNYCDPGSLSNSPGSHTGSIVESNCSGTDFSGSNSSSSSSSNSSSSGASYSGNISEEEDDGVLDDWEAVADALASTDDKPEQHKHKAEEDKNIIRSDPLPALVNQPASVREVSKPKQQINRAWRHDDAFRPQNLPNLVKNHSFPLKSKRHYGQGGTAWVNKNVISASPTCPICCEDLDITDSSFLPCLCGFRLCLFCHKRILEEDGRCPGCRKHYDCDGVNGHGNSNSSEDSAALGLARSCSMITRS